MHFHKKKSEEDGEQILTDGSGQDKMFSCFRCSRNRLECAGTRNCKNTNKVDGSNIDSKEAVEELIK